MVRLRCCFLAAAERGLPLAYVSRRCVVVVMRLPGGSVFVAVSLMIDSGMMSCSGVGEDAVHASVSGVTVELPARWGSSTGCRAASPVSCHSARPGVWWSAGRSKELVYQVTAAATSTAVATALTRRGFMDGHSPGGSE